MLTHLITALHRMQNWTTARTDLHDEIARLRQQNVELLRAAVRAEAQNTRLSYAAEFWKQEDQMRS